MVYKFTNRRIGIRINGFVNRSRSISFPNADGLRPTGNRIRETLFNWLGQTLNGKSCLDLFAGSGALGFEAISRGARQVVMVDAARKVCRSLKENADNLDIALSQPDARLTIAHRSALDFLSSCAERYDIVFLDPPFNQHRIPELLAAITPHLAPQAIVYVEQASAIAELSTEWHIIKESRAGQVRFALLGHSQGKS